MKKALGSGSAISRLLSPSASLPHGAPRLESLRLFLSRAQRRGDALSADAFLPFLAACRPFPSLARQGHALMLKSGADLHPATATALLDLYGRRGLLREALRVFDGMPLRDPIAWNALLSCFLRQGLAAEAVSALRRMTEDGIPFTGVTLSAALKACASLRAVRLGKQIHARAVREGDSSLVTSTSLIDFYSSCGLIQNAFDVFAGVDCEKDAAIYNSLISACIENRRSEEAFSILRSWICMPSVGNYLLLVLPSNGFISRMSSPGRVSSTPMVAMAAVSKLGTCLRRWKRKNRRMLSNTFLEDQSYHTG